MITLEHILLGGVLPAVLVLLLLSVTWRIWRRDGDFAADTGRTDGGPAGVGRSERFDTSGPPIAGTSASSRPADAIRASAGSPNASRRSDSSPTPVVRSSSRPADAAWSGPVAVAMAFGVAFVAIRPGLPPLPAVVASDKLLYLAIALGLLGATLRSPRLPIAAAAILAAAVGGGMVAWVLRGLVPHAMSLGGLVGWSAGLGLLAGVWAMSGEAIARKTPGWASGIWLALMATASAAIVSLSGSQKLGQYAGGIAAAAGAAAVLAIIRPRITLARGGMAVGMMLLLATLVSVHFYAAKGLPPAIAGLFVIAPVLGAASTLPMFTRTSGFTRGTIAIALTLLALLAAIGIGVLTFLGESSAAATPYAY